MISKDKIILILIILIAGVFRLWQLGEIPTAPDWDEAALGYNAYSIRETGKDEYGESFPIILRSFDDYKPALYVYFVIPFISLFDLNIFSVRLPSAIFGVLTVLATYFLVYELFKRWEVRNGKLDNDVGNEKTKSHFSHQILSSHTPLLTSFLLAISPWHIQFSRIAFESNVGLAFNVFVALSFLKGLRKPLYLIAAAILAGINIYIYQSEKVFTPFLIFALILIFRKEFFKVSKKYLITSLIVAVFISLPLVFYTATNKEAFARAKGVSLFADQTQLLKNNALRLIEDRENNDLLGLVLDNRRILYTKEVVSGYLSHFDLNWLFITGDLARHHAPNMGLLYIYELPFLLIGIYSLLFNKIFDKKMKLVLFSWFLIAPIPASITSGVPHAVRTLNFLPTFQVFTAVGLITAFVVISNIKNQILNIQIKNLIFAMYFLFFIFNFLYYFNQYFVQQNYFYSEEWQYGYKEAVDEVKNISGNFEKIVVSNKPHLDQSYIFFLFYLEYPPALYQKESVGTSGGFRENHFFGNYEFRPIEWSSEEKTNTLFVGRPDDFPNDINALKTINFLDGEPAIFIVEG